MHQIKRMDNLIMLIVILMLLTGCTGKVTEADKTDYLIASGEEGMTESDAYKYKTVYVGDFYDEYEQAGQLYIQEQKPACAQYEYGEMKFVEFVVSAGDYVKAGDIIATVNIEVSDADIEKEKLSLQRMNERIEEDIKDYESIDSNLKSKAYGKQGEAFGVALREYEESRVRHNQDIESRRIAIGYQQELITKMENAKNTEAIYAPCEGYVRNLASLKRGDSVDNRYAIATVEPSKSDIITVYNEDNAFRYGKEVEIELTTGNGSSNFTGNVVTPSGNDMLKNMDSTRALIRVDLQDGELLDKSEVKKITVRVKNLQMNNVLMLDIGALEEKANVTYATIVDANGSFLKRRVIIGKRGKKAYWILRGLKEGDKVVVP